MHESESKADWLSFVLHFIFGLIAGCIIGLVTILRRREGIWLQEELILPYLAGTSLIGGGLGAKFGDRLWMGSSYRVIPPDAPHHNRLSLYFSNLSVLLGFGLAATSLFKHFFVL